MTEEARRLADLSFNGDREKMAVFIGDHGCAVHPGGGDACCIEVSNRLALRIIGAHNLHKRHVTSDGFTYAA